MTRYEQLKQRQKAAIIVVCTLGLAAVPIVLNWNSNIFAGTSFAQGPLALFFKLLSFLLLTAVFAVPAFFAYLITLIVTTIELSNYKN